MSKDVFPPAAPGDPQRPASNADMERNDGLRQDWCDYLDTLHTRLVMRNAARRARYFRRCEQGAPIPAADPTPKPVLIYDVTDGAAPERTQRRWRVPQSHYTWEALRGLYDRRPTLAEAVDARGGLQAFCLATAPNQGNAGRMYRCELGASDATRAKMAAALHMAPEAIRWPVRITNESEVA